MANHPDFICVGAQKAATTWLYNALRWVPGIFLPALKELHYFSQFHCDDTAEYALKQRRRRIDEYRAFLLAKEIRNEYQNMVLRQLDHLDREQLDDEWYRGIFGFADTDDICGEICPSYLTMPMPAMRHLMSINPMVRIIVIVRDPVDRAWSHMRMHAKAENLTLDADAIVRGELPLTLYLDYSEYAGSIERWKHMTASGRLKILSYDQVGSEPRAVFDEITRFIGLSGAEPRGDLGECVFSGGQSELPGPIRALLLDKLEPQYKYLGDIFPELAPAWLERHRELV